MQRVSCCRRSNCLAMIIFAGTAGIGYLSLEAQPAGANLVAMRSIHQLAQILPVATPSTDSPSGNHAPVAAAPRIEGKLALLMNIALLQHGRAIIEKHPAYTAIFHKQEKIGKNSLDELQTIEMKLRHAPFSVYMKWHTIKTGQEVLFVENEFDNLMLVKKGGAVGNLIPTIKLLPDSPLALMESRHPVTDAGILSLTDKLLSYRLKDIDQPEKVACQLIAGQKIADRPCYCFEVTYDSEQTEPVYRKSLTWIDEELSIPVCVKNYTWASKVSQSDEADEEEETVEEGEDPGETPELSVEVPEKVPVEDPTLIEFYTFTDIHFEKQPHPQAFDSANKDYRFKRQ